MVVAQERLWQQYQRMETIRWFAPEVEEAAADWRHFLVHDGSWTQVEADAGFAHGEAQGFFVTCGPLDGYAKQSGDQFRAAHEKIASDLAYDLNLPVPPVVLIEPDARRCAVSRLPFVGPQKWGVARHASTSVSEIAPRLAGAASAMTVFDTWVDNRDRVNEGNLIVSTALSDGPGIAYIDYAYSLTYGWGEGPAPAATNAVPRYPDLWDIDWTIVARTIERIEQLQEQAIADVVDRLPEAFLPPSRKEAAREGLLVRRGHLRGIFEAQLGDKL